MFRGLRATGIATFGIAALAATFAFAQASPDPDEIGERGVVIMKPAEDKAKQTAAPVPVPTMTQSAAPLTPPKPAPKPAPVADVAPGPLPSPVVKPCERPFKRPAVELSARSSSTRALRAALNAKGQSVVADLAEPFPVDGPTPDYLAPWISEVKASGGMVSVKQYCQNSRGFFSFLRKLFNKDKQDPYAAVHGYDVVMHVDGLVGVVTQIEFERRTAN